MKQSRLTLEFFDWEVPKLTYSTLDRYGLHATDFDRAFDLILFIAYSLVITRSVTSDICVGVLPSACVRWWNLEIREGFQKANYFHVSEVLTSTIMRFTLSFESI